MAAQDSERALVRSCQDLPLGNRRPSRRMIA
jgi:hypothetical protein